MSFYHVVRDVDGRTEFCSITGWAAPRSSFDEARAGAWLQADAVEVADTLNREDGGRDWHPVEVTTA